MSSRRSRCSMGRPFFEDPVFLIFRHKSSTTKEPNESSMTYARRALLLMEAKRFSTQQVSESAKAQMMVHELVPLFMLSRPRRRGVPNNVFVSSISYRVQHRLPWFLSPDCTVPWILTNYYTIPFDPLITGTLVTVLLNGRHCQRTLDWGTYFTS